MSKQDRQGVRTATELEQKYKFNERFAELLGIATDAREKVEEAESTLREEMTEQYSNLSRTTEQISAEVGNVKTTTDRQEESISSLVMTDSSIIAEVRNVKTATDANKESVDEVKNYISTVTQRSDQLEVKINKLAEDGVTTVSNTTGTFDDEGLTIDKTDSATKTQVTPDGMTVYSKGYSGETEVLSATSDGVDATNLHAKTWLTVGGRSRFENYGSDRTGCFWIGGE